MQRKNIQIDGSELSYMITGSGPTLVFLHGFGEDSRIWENQFAAFPGFQLVVPDLPGSGASSAVKDMSLENLARLIQQLLQKEAIEKCVLFGHSMGGYIALAFAALFPQTLTGLGLIHSTAFADTLQKIETRKKGIDFIKKNGAAAFLKTSSPNLFAPDTQKHFPELIEQHLARFDRFTEAALVAYYESMIQRPDRTPILKGFPFPVLIVAGRHDTAVPLQDSLNQSYLPRVSYIHILEKSGHMGMLEEPGKTNQCIKEYLSLLAPKN